MLFELKNNKEQNLNKGHFHCCGLLSSVF